MDAHTCCPLCSPGQDRKELRNECQSRSKACYRRHKGPRISAWKRAILVTLGLWCKPSLVISLLWNASIVWCSLMQHVAYTNTEAANGWVRGSPRDPGSALLLTSSRCWLLDYTVSVSAPIQWLQPSRIIISNINKFPFESHLGELKRWAGLLVIRDPWLKKDMLPLC